MEGVSLVSVSYCIFLLNGILKPLKTLSGVGGFTLGGGFSYKSSQYGLGSDNVISYDLVTYSGQTLTVTAQSNKDLFFALQVNYYYVF